MSQSKNAMMNRLGFEIARATTPETIVRLRETLAQVEQHLIATQKDADEEEWCDLLARYTEGMKLCMAQKAPESTETNEMVLFGNPCVSRPEQNLGRFTQ